MLEIKRFYRFLSKILSKRKKLHNRSKKFFTCLFLFAVIIRIAETFQHYDDDDVNTHVEHQNEQLKHKRDELQKSRLNKKSSLDSFVNKGGSFL